MTSMASGHPIVHVESVLSILTDHQQCKLASSHAKQVRLEQAERVKVWVERRTAAKLAAAIWTKAAPALDAHPYLMFTGVPAYGLRCYRGRLTIGGMACDGALLIPAHDVNGILTTLQFIDERGTQRFLSGGKPVGSFYLIGHPARVLCLAEDYATAARIHQATGHSVAVAFDADNLSAVARALRAKFPDTPLVICTNDGRNNPDRSGLSKASFSVEEEISK